MSRPYRRPRRTPPARPIAPESPGGPALLIAAAGWTPFVDAVKSGALSA
ncbi:hypothetical protein ACFY8V_24525 [Streptomyces californicus]